MVTADTHNNTDDNRNDTHRADRLSLSELAITGALIAVIAIALNLLIMLVFTSLFTIDDDFSPMTPGPIVTVTIIGTIAALLVFLVIQRLSARPLRVFQVVALIALLVSLIPVLGLLTGDSSQDELRGANGPAVVGLMLMHGVVAALVVGLLTRRHPAR